jgi:hypothetical protein
MASGNFGQWRDKGGIDDVGEKEIDEDKSHKKWEGESHVNEDKELLGRHFMLCLCEKNSLGRALPRSRAGKRGGRARTVADL